MNEVISIYKPEGITPVQLIAQFKSNFPSYMSEKISVAGRLDPMASGLMLLLIGNANKKRQDYLTLDKTYKFTFLCGLTTDTYDILGKPIVITKNIKHILTSELVALFKDFIKPFEQQYPSYSSMHVAGKPLFYWARQNKLSEITIPSKSITIKKLTYHSTQILSQQELLENIKKRISLVKGDFRQTEILSSWQDISSQLPKKLQLFSLQANVTSGTYIRSLCNSLGEKLGTGSIAYQIERTAIGRYTLQDAIKLTD